ncbi:MAG: hypothetical protein ACOX5R_19205 [bacterium]|jgi:hypothetical protein
MANGYSRTPVLIKGALIRFDAPLLIPIPNIIIFQYNPDTFIRNLTPYTPPRIRDTEEDSDSSTESRQTERSQPYDPEESFSLKLILDASDALEKPQFHPVAVISGVADRIAALEMLLYPVTEGVQLLGSIAASVSVSAGGASISAGGSAAGETVPNPRVPVTLLIWGPGRIVPVRLTSFSVEEQAFSPLLYPIRATVNVGMKVLQPAAFQRRTGSPSPEEQLATAAYQFTMTQKQLLATANLANSVESIINMLPI